MIEASEGSWLGILASLAADLLVLSHLAFIVFALFGGALALR